MWIKKAHNKTLNRPIGAQLHPESFEKGEKNKWPIAAFEVTWVGVSCANTIHLQVATLSRTNEITVQVPHLKRNIQSLSIVAQTNKYRAVVIPRQKRFYRIWLYCQQAHDSWLKMTQSARLYGAACTFNDSRVFTFQAAEEPDGKGTYDWQSTKDRHKAVKSGANYSRLIYSLAAKNQSISLFGHKHTENCFNKRACKGLCHYLESLPESKPQTFTKATYWSSSINHSQLEGTLV